MIIMQGMMKEKHIHGEKFLDSGQVGMDSEVPAQRATWINLDLD
jgi:hypothetical protein